MVKKLEIFQEFPRGLAGISLINLQYFGHNFGTRNARKSIKPSKDSYQDRNQGGHLGGICPPAKFHNIA